ncbi:MAG: hypothetical protein O7D86_01055 [Proteobacteria bacterium]|nr:hypothetical protein [Pseudomonadota bacterium]
MNKFPISSSTSIEKFWDRYLELLYKQDIKPSATRWYVYRAEAYIKAFTDKKLVDHTAEDVKDYLAKLGRSGQIKDWQFRYKLLIF